MEKNLVFSRIILTFAGMKNSVGQLAVDLAKQGLDVSFVRGFFGDYVYIAFSDYYINIHIWFNWYFLSYHGVDGAFFRARLKRLLTSNKDISELVKLIKHISEYSPA